LQRHCWLAGIRKNVERKILKDMMISYLLGLLWQDHWFY